MRFATFLALLLALVVAVPASAGRYDVVTCSGAGPGGVNNAWTADRAGSFNPGEDHENGYAVESDCERGGLLLSPGAGNATVWGTWKYLALRPPPDTRIAKLVLWRQSSSRTTPAGGAWKVTAVDGDGGQIGGPNGPDQCRPGEGFFPDPCGTGAPGYGDSAISRYDLSADSVRLGLQCLGEFASCTSRDGSGASLAYIRIRASIATIQDDTLPAIVAGGPLLEPGWRRGNAEIAVSATDNSGIKNLRVLLDGQERSRADVSCDYTFTRPCADLANRTLTLGGDPITDGPRQVQIAAEDAAGNITTITRSVSIDAHGPEPTLTRASGRTITVRVADGASGVAGGTIEVRNRRSEPFRALPTTLANGRLTARLDRGSASKVGIRVSVSDKAGNSTAGQLNELALRVGGKSLRGGAASVSYGRRARVTGRMTTRDGQIVAGVPVTVESTPRVGARRVVATVTTSSRGGFTYRAPAGVSRTLKFTFAGGADLAPLARSATLRVRASSTISASRRVLTGRGRVRFSGRLGLRGAATPRSGKIVELQAFDGGRWRVFATARARGSKGRWSAAYTFAGTPGRYPVRLRIRREAVFPYDLGYSRSVVIRVR